MTGGLADVCDGDREGSVMDALEIEIRQKVIDALNLEDFDPETISRGTVLFQGGLGLDSIDAIELVIMIEKEFGIVLSVAERNQTVFRDFGSLCDFIRQNINRDKPVRQAV